MNTPPASPNSIGKKLLFLGFVLLITALLNYAFGLTRVKFTHYILASWIAMLPGTLLFVYLGSLARTGVKGGEKTPLEWTMYGAGLIATLAVTVYITKVAKKAIAEMGLAPTASATDVKP